MLAVFALIRHESNQMFHRDVLVPNPNVLSRRRVTIDNVLVVCGGRVEWHTVVCC